MVIKKMPCIDMPEFPKKMTKKSPKAPNTRCDGTMTEAAYLAFIRSTLRSKSLRWPPRTNALNAARRTYVGTNKLQKWEYLCTLCNCWFKAKEVCVDHYPKPAGSILSVQDIGAFSENLFCNSTNLRVLCVPCHAIHTLAEANGISFAEARIEKSINEICKQPVNKVLAYLEEKGYTGSSVSNADKRKALVSKLIKEKTT